MQAGPAEGGWRVTARLPIGRAAAAPRALETRLKRLRRIDRADRRLGARARSRIGGSIEVAAKADLQGPLLLNVLATSPVASPCSCAAAAPAPAVDRIGVALVMAAFLTQPSEMSSLFLGLMIFPWAPARSPRAAASALGLALAVLTIVVVALDSDEFIWGDIFFPGVFGTMLWLAGRAVRSRSRADRRAARGDGCACTSSARPRRAPPSPTSAAGSRARCTTSSPTASR